jgi:hypothetical protein
MYPKRSIYKAQWSLWEQGIHPPVRLKYFNEQRFEAIKALWQKICIRWPKKVEKPFKKIVIKPSEPHLDRDLFEYKSYWEARETRYWQWMRVHEYFRGFTDDWYEHQITMAGKLMNRHHIDRMLISYNY